MALPDSLDKMLLTELSEFEEARGMPYVTSVERIGIEKGLQLGLQLGSLQEAREMVLEAIAARFGVAPEEVMQAVNAIESRETLRSLLRQAINCADLEAFREALRLARS